MHGVEPDAEPLTRASSASARAELDEDGPRRRSSARRPRAAPASGPVLGRSRARFTSTPHRPAARLRVVADRADADAPAAAVAHRVRHELGDRDRELVLGALSRAPAQRGMCRALGRAGEAILPRACDGDAERGRGPPASRRAPVADHGDDCTWRHRTTSCGRRRSGAPSPSPSKSRNAPSRSKPLEIPSEWSRTTSPGDYRGSESCGAAARAARGSFAEQKLFRRHGRPRDRLHRDVADARELELAHVFVDAQERSRTPRVDARAAPLAPVKIFDRHRRVVLHVAAEYAEAACAAWGS